MRRPAPAPIPPNWRVGTVLLEGSGHVRESKGLQDALSVQLVDRSSGSSSCSTGALNYTELTNGVVAVVCDGTSQAEYDGITLQTRNQVGAVLFADLIARKLASELANDHTTSGNLQSCLSGLLPQIERQLRNLVRSVAGRSGRRPAVSDSEFRTFVGTHFFTTILGLVVRRDEWAFFGLGDGFYLVDERISAQNDRFVIGQAWVCRKREKPCLRIHEAGQLGTIGKFCIATDGIATVMHESRVSDFYRFYNDERTCQRNSYGEDTTIVPFRTCLRQPPFEDDVALIMLKREAPGR